MLFDRLWRRIIRVKRVRRAQVSLVEAWDAVSIAAGDVNDSVKRAVILPTCPFVDQVTHVDNENVFQRRNSQPFSALLMIDLKAVHPRLLKEDGNATEIGMSAGAKLVLISGRMWWIVQELQIDHRFFCECLEDGDVMSEAHSENLQQCLAQSDNMFVVSCDGCMEDFARKFRPLIWTFHKANIIRGYLAADIKALASVSV